MTKQLYIYGNVSGFSAGVGYSPITRFIPHPPTMVLLLTVPKRYFCCTFSFFVYSGIDEVLFCVIMSYRSSLIRCLRRAVAFSRASSYFLYTCIFPAGTQLSDNAMTLH